MLQSNDCGCVIYECTVSGEGPIIWSGSAFECIGTNNELVLFGVEQDTVECNKGGIKAQRNGNYTFQHIITDEALSGSNIECIHENGTKSNVIGSLSIPTIAAYSGKLILMYIQIYIKI